VDSSLAVLVVDCDVDVLEWWRHHSAVCPCLARIARDHLAILATGVPASRVFSGGADPIRDKRGG